MKKTSIIRKLGKSQRGFTLIELIIALSIASAIGVAATMTAHNLITIPIMSNDSNTAINQVRNAVNWINRDVQGAAPSTITIDDSPGTPDFFSVSLQEWASGTWSTHTIAYSLIDMAGTTGLKELWRDYDNGTTKNIIAQFIEPEAAGVTECSWDDINNTLTVTITATVGDQTETRIIQVKPRPTG